MDSVPFPRLAQPGAGLPAAEHLIAKALFALRRWSGNRKAFAALFDQERAAIFRQLTKHDEPALCTRTLIPRLRGLEDSSRYWSVYMTLDHLRIVNDQIAGVIDSLTQGHVPPVPASTATVKPSPDANTSVVATYERACDRLTSLVESKGDLRTTLRFAHPWFGPLDALGWHALSAMHMGIHRAQIDRILATIKNPSP